MTTSISSSINLPPSRLHVLDLSEIRALIAQHLSKQDLAYCTLVSKSWSQGYLPHYWHTVHVSTHKLARCHASAVLHHGRHIRYLAAGRIEDTSVFNQSSVSHLQRLEVSTCGNRFLEDDGRGCLQEIVQRNQGTLKAFCWRCHGRDTSERPYRLWASMFAGLDNLETIVLSNWCLSRTDFVRVLVACPVLRSMALDATEEALPLDGGRPDHTDDASLLTFQHERIQRLEFSGQFLLFMLQHVPTIEQLELSRLFNGDLHNVSDHVNNKKSTHLSRLHHLTIRTACGSPTQFMALAGAVTRLVHFEGMVPFPVMGDFFDLVLLNHSQTIEHLVLLQDSYDQLLFRFNIWRFMESCPRLMTLEFPFPLHHCMTWTTPELVDKLYEPTKEWVCNDLRRLQLQINDMDRMSPMGQITIDLCVDRLLPSVRKRDNAKRTRTSLERIILERLSGLEKLECLDIGGGWYDLPTRMPASGSKR
ncbi:hypothetical protein BGX31_000007 [Mortierella sp. GBA43]|nr:hypothetical protein BGX31_000007 [Mortierella sp. GBA43]